MARLCDLFNRRDNLRESARRAGLTIDTWSPGDGVTRYRFFVVNDPDGSDYFGGRGIFTALGLKEAFAFVAGAWSVKSCAR